jgi:hypothetical protein
MDLRKATMTTHNAPVKWIPRHVMTVKMSTPTRVFAIAWKGYTSGDLNCQGKLIFILQVMSPCYLRNARHTG